MLAICTRCGLKRKRFRERCRRCGLNPCSSPENRAKSIRLSTLYLDKHGEPLSKQELGQISRQIESGNSYSFEDAELAALLRQKKLLDAGLSDRDKAKIAGYLLLLFLPLIGLMVFILRGD